MGTNAFAEACGVSSQAMSGYLRPGRSLTTVTIYNIANALDIDPRDMFFPTEDEPTIQKEENQSDTASDSENAAPEAQPVQTTAYCPHCGAKVRVGVVLLPE